MDNDFIALSDAAISLKLPYQNAHRLLLTGRLQGERRGGRWFVTARSTKQVREESERESERRAHASA